MKNYLKKIGFILTILMTVIILPSTNFAGVSENNDLSKYAVSEDEKFNRIFREGRELIDKEEWAKAAAKFREIACDCPENKYVDAALYWLAFCYKKQKMFAEMDAAIDRLLKNYPNSSWADDARVMKYEGRIGVVSATSPSYTVGVVSSNGVGNSTAATILTTSSQIPLEREDEIKLAAFQSLLSAEPQRAITILGDILKSDSKASESLKREIIRTFRMPRFVGSGKNVYPNETVPAKTINQFLPQLRETLVKGYQTESNEKIRAEIIYAPANINDEQSTNYVIKLYSSEENKELKKAIINSLGGSYFYLSETNSNTSVKANFDKLAEIIRIEKDPELRRLALSNLQKFAGWSNKEGVIETLSQIYDSENDDEFKISIIQSLALSKQNQATMKLLEIAKKDKSDKMRLEAIRALRTSNNPEVIKFLEDLIK
ncbi:MAG TPA: tetratricopeptide repeat protein [Pyrinomonadaceae bacterium]|nr:tetratricopeptide repeat protein [Pyrinomonadaceae bacterium]